MSMMLVTHDMGVVARMADRITVMYAGRVCETADAAHDLSGAAASLHARAAGKRAARRPHLRRGGVRTTLPMIGGRLPNLLHPPPGCRFHPRCPEAIAECSRVVPLATAVAPGHIVSCMRRGSDRCRSP